MNLSFNIYELSNGVIVSPTSFVGNERNINIKANIGDYLKNDYGYFIYQGTTNVPTCKEQTLWVVIDKPLYVADI